MKIWKKIIPLLLVLPIACERHNDDPSALDEDMKYVGCIPISTDGVMLQESAEQASPIEDVSIAVKYDDSGDMIISSKNRSFRPGIERTVQETIVKLIPYKGETLVYTKVRNNFSLFIVQKDETFSLLNSLIENAFGGGDIQNSDLPDMAIHSTRLAGVSEENGIEILIEGTRDYHIVADSNLLESAGSGDIGISDLMENTAPNGYYTVRLFCEIENGKLVCKKKLCLCEDFKNFPKDIIPFNEK